MNLQFGKWSVIFNAAWRLRFVTYKPDSIAGNVFAWAIHVGPVCAFRMRKGSKMWPRRIFKRG